MHRPRAALLTLLGALLLLAIATVAHPLSARAANSVCEGVAGVASLPSPDLHRPPESDGPTIVDTALRVIEVTDIDVRRGQFRFRGYVDFAWCDRRLAFEPAEAGVDARVFVGAAALEALGEMWNPDLALANEVSGIEVTKRELTIRSDGRIRVRGLFAAHLAANFDLRRFPFDSQVLPIQVESFSWNDDVLLFRVDAEGIGARRNFELAEWAIGTVKGRVERIAASRGDQHFSRFQVDVAIARRPGFYLWKAVLPLLLIVGVSWAVFWIPEGVGGRIRLSATVLLTIVAYQFAISSDLPKVAYVNLFSAFTTVSFVTVVLTILVNLAVFRRQERGDEAAVERSDRFSRWLIPVLYLAAVASVGVVYLR